MGYIERGVNIKSLSQQNLTLYEIGNTRHVKKRFEWKAVG